LVSIPIGVGSLAQAAVIHYRSGQAGAPAILGVEPEAAPCVLASLRRGEFGSVPTGTTVMAGLNCGTPSTLAWPVLAAGLDADIAVSEEAAVTAAADLAAAGIPAGGTGSAALAGARAALTGPGAKGRREELGVTSDSVLVLLCTDGRRDGATGGVVGR
jgi:diaminopropionate ammonia-lyase